LLTRLMLTRVLLARLVLVRLLLVRLLTSLLLMRLLLAKLLGLTRFLVSWCLNHSGLPDRLRRPVVVGGLRSFTYPLAFLSPARGTPLG